MKNQSSIEKLIHSGKKVFTTDDLAIIWQISDRSKLLERVKYYLRQDKLVRLHKGVYAYGEYTPFEAAQKLNPLSYLSLYTTSQMHGLTFQYYRTIFSISLRNRKYEIEGQKFEYHKVKEEIFYSQIGLVRSDGYTMANRERTICDMLYIYPRFAFDDIKEVDTTLLRDISRIYGNKRLEKDIANIIKEAENGQHYAPRP